MKAKIRFISCLSWNLVLFKTKILNCIDDTTENWQNSYAGFPRTWAPLNHKTNMAIYGTSRDKTKINKQLT